MKTSVQWGASLAEMMVAILVGAILTAGMIQIVVNNKASYNTQESLSRLKENGRFARYIIQRDLRMAGFQGCNNSARVPANNLIKNPSIAAQFESDNVIIGYHGQGDSWSPSLPNWITQNLPAGTRIVPGTDVITIRKLSSVNIYLSQPMGNNTSRISLPDQITIAPRDTLYITDCESTDIFHASAGSSNTSVFHTTTDNTSNALSKAYSTDAAVGHVTTTTYYIRTSNRTNRTGQPLNVLARLDINGNEQVLIEGIDNMKINYGVDNNDDGAPDTFITADAVAAQNAWPNVVSIRIAQLLNSIEEVGKPNQRFTFQGTTRASDDRMLRRQWNTYVTVRNRAL